LKSPNTFQKDRIVSLEYQVNKLKLTQIKKKQVSDEVLNEVGNLIYKGEMKDGKRHGKGIEYSPNIKGGVIYEGEFVDGYYEGEGVLNLVSSNILSRNILIKNQNSYTGTFKNGVFHGLIKHIAPWKQSEVNYKDGIQHGLYTSYTGGTLTKAPWKQLEINFKNGKEHGTYKQYEEQGGVIHDHTYNEGIQVG
jgi:antitoxin component YwqK of YwqJK toxin-antitoxin module